MLRNEKRQYPNGENVEKRKTVSNEKDSSRVEARFKWKTANFNRGPMSVREVPCFGLR